MEADLSAGADDQLGGAAADVEDEGRVRVGAMRGRAEIGEVASSSPVSMRASSSKRSRSSAMNASPLTASRTALVAIAMTRSAPISS